MKTVKLTNQEVTFMTALLIEKENEYRQKLYMAEATTIDVIVKKLLNAR